MDYQLAIKLIEFYKAKGIDLHYLLDDPYFKALPLSEKIKAIQANAQELLTGTSRTISKSDLRTIGVSSAQGALVGGLTGIASGIAASRMFNKGAFNPVVLGTSAIVGGLYGAIKSGWDQRTNIANRIGMHNQLQKVVDNPSYENALHTLMLRNLQKERKPNRILEDYANQQTNKFLDRIKTDSRDQTISFNNDLGNKRING